MIVTILEHWKSNSYDLVRIKALISYKTKDFLKLIEVRANPKEIKRYRERYKASNKKIYLDLIKHEEIFLHLKQELKLFNILKKHLEEI